MTAIEFSSRQLNLVGKSVDDFFKLMKDIDYIFFNIDGSEYNREFVETRESKFICYERFGAKRGHWIEGFLREKMPQIVAKQISRYAELKGIAL